MIDDIKAVRRTTRLAGRRDRGGAQGEKEKEQGVFHPVGKVKASPSGPIFCEHYLRRFGYTLSGRGRAGAIDRPHSGKDGRRLLFPIGLLPPEMGEGPQARISCSSSLFWRGTCSRASSSAPTGSSTQVRKDGRRAVNVDPGYIALEHVVLGTTKGFSHRIYLGEGIFADLTLLYENGSYRRLKWTYPDYGSDQLIFLLNGWRERYKGLLRCQRV